MFALICCTCFALLGFRALGKIRWRSLPAWFCLWKFFGAGDGHSAVRCRRCSWPSRLDRLPGHTTIQAERCRCGGASARLVLGSGIAFSLAALACTAPAIAHHVSLNEGWVISTNNELNFSSGQQSLHAELQNLAFGRGGGARRAHAGLQSICRIRLQSGPHPAHRHGARSPALYRRASGDLFLLRTANRIRAFWGADHIAAATVRGGWPRSGKRVFALCPAVEAGGYCLTMLLVICDLFLAPAAMAKTDVALLIAAVLAYQLPYTISFAYSIYHFPVMGLLFPFAGLALAQAWREGRRSGGPSRAGSGSGSRKGIFVLNRLEYACQVIAYEGTSRY